MHGRTLFDELVKEGSAYLTRKDVLDEIMSRWTSLVCTCLRSMSKPSEPASPCALVPLGVYPRSPQAIILILARYRWTKLKIVNLEENEILNLWSLFACRRMASGLVVDVRYPFSTGTRFIDFPDEVDREYFASQIRNLKGRA